MKFNLYHDVKLMYQDTYEVLMKNEVLNSVLLGNLIRGNNDIDTKGWKDSRYWFMATVTNNQEIYLIALMTPPFNITLYEAKNDENSLDCLVEGIIESNIILPGVMCEKSLAERFAQKYTQKMNLKYEISINQGIYELVNVNSNLNYLGKLRLLQESDYAFIPYWYEDAMSFFHRTALKNVGTDLSSYQQRDLYILEHEGTPVSFAKITRIMQTFCCISLVYTPPFFRNHGYATSCVAKLSQIILDRGFEKCALYTDLDYPVSNSIYKKIGYRLVFNSLEISFKNIN